MNEENLNLHDVVNKNKDRDYLQIATAFDNSIRIYIAKTTQIVQDAQNIHHMYPTAIAALGRTLTATVIMGQMLKADQSIAVKIEGDGPIGKIVCESDTSGRVMGYVQNGGVYLKYNNGKLDVKDAVGQNGTLTVVKDLHLKEPFTSTIDLVSGEIAEDFTYYFAKSEQVPSSVALGVLVGLNNQVLAAGGFIVQVLPDCKEEAIKIIEDNLKKIAPISNLILENKSSREIIKLITGSDNFTILKNSVIKFKCRCSKERFEKGIKSLGYETLKKIYDEDHKLTATCQYCLHEYNFSDKELESILEGMKKTNENK